jgi:uncharacterized protein (DUF111 family)
MGYKGAMASELLFQTESGASGDMILAALIDLLDRGDEFRLKVNSWRGGEVNVQPEFADVVRLTEELGVPAKEALRMVLGAIHEKHGPGQD